MPCTLATGSDRASGRRASRSSTSSHRARRQHGAEPGLDAGVDDVRWRQQSDADDLAREWELLRLSALPIQERAATGELDTSSARSIRCRSAAAGVPPSGDRRAARRACNSAAGPCRCPSAKLIAQISRNVGHRRHAMQQRMQVEARPSDDDGRPMLGDAPSARLRPRAVSQRPTDGCSSGGSTPYSRCVTVMVSCSAGPGGERRQILEELLAVAR